MAAAAASAAGVAGAVLAVVSAMSMSLCAPSSTLQFFTKGREEDFHRHNLFKSLCETERPTARARSGSQSFHTELGGPPARRPAFKFSKEETRSRGESQRHPLRGHASVHVPLGAPVLVSVENIQSRGNRVGRKRTGGTDCVARRRDLGGTIASGRCRDRDSMKHFGDDQCSAVVGTHSRSATHTESMEHGKTFRCGRTSRKNPPRP